MVKIAKYLFCLLAVFCLYSFTAHKFYVAVFNMEYVPAKKVVQVTSRVFIDDLDAALYKRYNKKLMLATVKEHADADRYIEDYFTEKMQVKVNGVASRVKYLGRETEDDVLICYYTFPAETAIRSIEVGNTVLFELFEDQQNIIHTNINRNKKSLLLTNGRPGGLLEY